MNSRDVIQVVPGENIEDEEEDLSCARRPRKNGRSQIHVKKSIRIDHHDANDVIDTSTHSRPKSLSEFPSDIHHQIFASLEDAEDVLRFSLANRYFWAVGLTHIENHIISASAPWAGTRILCAGDSSKPGDYPPGLLTPMQREEIEAISTPEGRLMNLYDLWHVYNEVGHPSLSNRLQRCFHDYEKKHPMSRADRTEIRMGLQPEVTEFYPRDQQWVLRNLTTREYVGGEAVALKEEFIRGPQIDLVGFSEVLIARTSWSSVGEAIPGNITRGKWAGHKFDIIPLAVQEEKMNTEEWTNVSNEVLREIDIIFTSMLGDDWRAQLLQSQSG